MNNNLNISEVILLIKDTGLVKAEIYEGKTRYYLNDIESLRKFINLVNKPKIKKPVPLSTDEIEEVLGHEPLDYRQGFFNGARFAELTHDIG